MWIIDPVTKKKSVTLTAFIIGFLVATGKLAVSGLILAKWGLTLEKFTGGEYAAVVGALGAIYWARRNIMSKK